MGMEDRIDVRPSLIDPQMEARGWVRHAIPGQRIKVCKVFFLFQLLKLHRSPPVSRTRHRQLPEPTATNMRSGSNGRHEAEGIAEMRPLRAQGIIMTAVSRSCAISLVRCCSARTIATTRHFIRGLGIRTFFSSRSLTISSGIRDGSARPDAQRARRNVVNSNLKRRKPSLEILRRHRRLAWSRTLFSRSVDYPARTEIRSDRFPSQKLRRNGRRRD